MFYYFVRCTKRAGAELVEFEWGHKEFDEMDKMFKEKVIEEPGKWVKVELIRTPWDDVVGDDEIVATWP
jgi:hypothetical protein